MRFDKNQEPHQRIRVLRILRNLKQWELAEKLGIDQQSISDWETGKHEPGYYYRRRIAEALDVEPKDIWG